MFSSSGIFLLFGSRNISLVMTSISAEYVLDVPKGCPLPQTVQRFKHKADYCVHSIHPTLSFEIEEALLSDHWSGAVIGWVISLSFQFKVP